MHLWSLRSACSNVAVGCGKEPTDSQNKFVCLYIHCSKNLKEHFEISDLNTTKIIGVPLDLGQVSVGVSQANSQKRWGENIKAADSMPPQIRLSFFGRS